MLYVDLGSGEEVVVRTDGLSRVKPGETVPIGFHAASCHLFDESGRTVVNGNLL
jgi:hypothetical protein